MTGARGRRDGQALVGVPLVTLGVQEQTQISARRRKRRKPPRLRVNVHKPSELLAWANYWGCTQQNVRDAVKISGVMVEDVEDWLEINVVLPR
jgi:hypothetical protein